MLRASRVLRRAEIGARAVADRIVLDHGDRHRRRLAMTARGGLAFLLDLAAAAVLEDGDALELEDGRLVGIEAKPERLLEIRADSTRRLNRILWHVGNRHVPAEIADASLYIAEDHVLAEMVRGLGGTATPVLRPFRPERGAYDGHGHDRGHSHGHDHAHDHSHDHSHPHG